MACSIEDNVVTLFSPFSIPFTPNASNPLNFMLPNVIMPLSVKPTAGLKIETFILENGTLFTVDS